MPGSGLPVTPVLLTLDEEPNLGRALASLRWADRVVVVDSGSTDRTEAVARSFPNVAWFARPWEGFGAQWRFGLERTGIETPFVLALDADMAVADGFPAEVEEGFLPSGRSGGVVAFEYRYDGVPLRGSLYPPQLRLVRRDAARVGERGHAHRIESPPPHYRFRSRVVHDDRKPLSRWVASQLSYVEGEAALLAEGGSGRLRSLLRRTGLAPAVVGSAAWLRAGGPLGGAGALRYAMERAAFESLLGIRIMGDRLRARRPGGGEG